LGGDHSISYASLQAVLEHHGTQNCGILIFDSHADLHQPSTSPSGNFHGMWLRPFLDTFEEAVINAAVPQKLHPNQVLFVGNLLTEPAEAAFMQSEHIENISAIDTAAQERVTQFLNSYHHIHVSFDIDVFASAYVPGVGTPNPSGLTSPQVWPLLRQIKTHPSISLDMVEVNPRQKGSERTVKLASRVLQEVLR
jgi:arginase